MILLTSHIDTVKMDIQPIKYENGKFILVDQTNRTIANQTQLTTKALAV